MNPGEQRLCDGHEIVGLISSMARKLVEARRAGVPLYLVGVRSRGVPLAQRLAQELCRLVGENVEVGAVDITLYRDDLGHAQRWPVLLGTDIPFDLEGADVVLVDDVLFTGRTVRAALNAICDLGRPACVRLAVLVDRGHRELPIRADFVGLELKTVRDEHVRVRLRPVDDLDEVVAIESAHGPSSQPQPPPVDGRPQP
jgi:pyrimidine operon attenuation protein / uracil phosphoribosyltransferase